VINNNDKHNAELSNRPRSVSMCPVKLRE